MRLENKETLALFRIRSESGSGAWCPFNQVNATSPAEWIQIELEEESWLTAVETQGRWDHGRGREFPTAYMLEYWRPSLGKWARYKDYRGEEVSLVGGGGGVDSGACQS